MIMQLKHLMRLRGRGLRTLALGVLACRTATSAFAASFAEPATVFYGKVIAAGNDAPYQLYQGRLEWVIQRADGSTLQLPTSLFALHDGEFSYRLDIPHEVLALGLTVSHRTVPLAAVPQTQRHVQILVDGQPATLLGPNGNTFDAAEALRTATYRLDLAVGLPALDSDGDGLPDWWEERFGEDDPGSDTDGDGLNNLAEFLAGTDPGKDSRAPTLKTHEVQAYHNGVSGLPLRVADADSSPDQITYTLVTPPTAGNLVLRNASASPTQPDATLTAGATWTQAAVAEGRLVYEAGAGSEETSSDRFTLRLADENPQHPATEQTVRVKLYGLPSAAQEQTAELAANERQRRENARLAQQEQVIVWDASLELQPLTLRVPTSDLSLEAYSRDYQGRFGSARRHILWGGLAADDLRGGADADVLIGGPGNDRLRGGPGADRFVCLSHRAGNDILEDFSLTDRDVLDIAALMPRSAVSVLDYVRVRAEGTDSIVEVFQEGEEGGPPTVALRVRGDALASQSLYDLVTGGVLDVGPAVLPPQVRLIARQAEASENGPTAGEMVLERQGDTTSELTVHLQMAGSALNGTDYRRIPETITMPAGADRVVIEVQPYADSLVEPAEIVEVSVAAGEGYTVDAANRALVTIQDLKPEISIEAVEPLAVQNPLFPGLFLITRSGVLDRSVLVRLELSGTAVRSVDYESIPSFINLLPNQTTALIEVTPRVAADLKGGRSVVARVNADAAYLVAGRGQAQVTLLAERLTFAEWRQRNFTGVPGNIVAFAAADTGQTGVPNLYRYAFGLDALNPNGSGGKPIFQVADGHLTVQFARPVEVTDVQYIVEVSEDLLHWQSGPSHIEPVGLSSDDLPAQTVTYRAVQSVDDLPRLFMRVRVIYTP